MQDHYADLLLDTSGLQSDLLVVEARARGQFFGQVPQRSGQSSIGKLTCQNLRQYTVNTNLRPNGHTRAYSRGKQNLFSNRGPLPKPTTKNQNIQQTCAKPTFSRSPKPTNDKQPTNQKEWLSAKYTWNALAQVWSAPFEEAPGLQC